MTVIGNHLAFSYRVSFIGKKKICRLVSIHVAFGTISNVCALLNTIKTLLNQVLTH